jgi:selenocysteine-specific elongation factor
MYTIGTAGHVDHGKSTLVQALTGIDPDRLREEKERGLTIDLGFAWFTLPDGREVSIVDVPGHERFIKNMLAGVGGIDLALVVVAADEGVMPQTREHLAIIDLLGIRQGVVALTKADLVDSDLLAISRAETEDLLEGTTLEGAPIVSCSGVTREGLENLIRALSEGLGAVAPRPANGRARLPIDRVFTMAGFGTVVTGTLIDGALENAQEVEIIPAGTRSRIRGLQSHGQKVDVASPGRRTAVNLAGVAVEDLRRGMVITAPGWMRPTEAVDVRLRCVRHLSRPVRHNLGVTFHTGSSETEGRLLLLDADDLKAGEEAWAQIRLAAPVSVVKGDHFIVRDPNDTLGGGVIVDTHVRRHRRFHGPTLAALDLLATGTPGETLLAALETGEPAVLSAVAGKAGLDEGSALRAAQALVAEHRLLALDGAPATSKSLIVSAGGFESLTESARDAVSAYHAGSPLRRGMAREELRSRLRLSPRVFEHAVAFWIERGDLEDRGGSIALPGHEPSADSKQQARAEAYLRDLEAQPFAPAPSDRLDETLLAYLQDSGRIVRMEDGVAFSATAYEEMRERVVAHLRENDTITLAEVRDMFGTSRRFAQALLEHMDGEHITRRTGDARVLQKRG